MTTRYERALERLAEIDRSVAARHAAERATDPWFTEGYDLAHQQHLDAMGHVDVEHDLGPDYDTAANPTLDSDTTLQVKPTCERAVDTDDDLAIEP